MPPSAKAEAAHERSEKKGEGGWGEKSEGLPSASVSASVKRRRAQPPRDRSDIDVRWEKREKFARTMYIDADLICLMGNKGDLPGKGYGERVRPSLAAIGCRKASAREKLCVKKGKRIATLRRD